MQLNRSQIEQLLPHRGSMSLLDQMLSWDEQSIVCSTGSHRLPEHPLRDAHGLGSANAIEYAAQAMALHAALLGASVVRSDAIRSDAVKLRVPPHGVLASVRSVRMRVARLDDIAADLTVTARLQSGDAQTAIYEFALHAQARELVSGRASVLFVVTAPAL